MGFMAMDLPEPELLDEVDPTAASFLAAAAAKPVNSIVSTFSTFYAQEN